MERVEVVAKALKEAKTFLYADHPLAELEKIGGPKAVDAIIKYGLKSDNSYIVETSIRKLERLHDKRSVPALIKYGLTNKFAAKRAMGALGTICDPSAVEPIIQQGIVKPNKNFSKAIAMEALTKITEGNGLNSIKALNKKKFKAEYEEIKKRAKEWRGWIEHHAEGLQQDNYVNEKELMKGATHHIEKLTETGSPTAAKALAKYGLTHKNKTVISRSKDALKNLNDSNITKILVKNLKSENTSTVNASIELLGDSGNKAALHHLMKMTGHEDEQTNNRLKKSIQKIQEANRG